MLTIPGSVGTAYVRLRPETTGFQGEATSSLKRSLIGIGTAVGGFFAAQQALGFVKQSVQTASSIQKSQETIQATMGKSSSAVEKFGRTSADSFLISKKDAESFAARIGIMGQNIGLTGKQSANMSVELLKLAGSFGQVKGEDPTPYLTKLSSALLGNTRGLKQMGIAISSTNELQAAQRLGFIKTTVDANAVAAARAKVAEYTAKVSEEEKKYGAQSSHTLGATASLKTAQDGLNKALAGSSTSTVSSLTSAQKAQVVMAVATSHLSSLQKEASAHSGDLANQTLRLTAEWSNAKDEVGLALLPVVTKLAHAFATDLPGAMHGFATAFHTAVADATPIVMPLVGAVKSLSVALADNRSLVEAVAGALVAWKVSMFAISEAQRIARDIQAAYNTVMAAGQALLGTEVTATQAAATAAAEHTGALQANTAALAEVNTGNATTLTSTTALVGAFTGATTASVAAAQADTVYTGAVERAGAAVALLSGANLELGTSYAVLSGAVADATVAQTAYDVALAATETTASGGALASLKTFGAGLVALAGGPVTLGIGAIAGLTAGMLYFASTEQSAVQKATAKLNTSLLHLDTNMRNVARTRKAQQEALSAIPEDKLQVATAKLNVEQARANLKNKDLNKTDLEHKQNVLALKQAILEQKDAQKRLNADETNAAADTKKLNVQIQAQIELRKHFAKSVNDSAKAQIEETISQITAVEKIKEGIGPRGAALSQQDKTRLAIEGSHKALGPWIEKLQEATAKQKDLTPTMRHNVTLLEGFGKAVGHIPSKKTIDMILNIKKPKEQLAALLQDFQGIAPKGHLFGVHLGTAFSQGTVEGMFKNAPKEQAQIQQNVFGIYKSAVHTAGIGSPSKLFETGVGQPIGDGIIKGIDDRTNALQTQIQHTLQSQVKPATAEAKSLGTGILQGILQPLGSLAGNLQSVIVSAANAAIAGARHALGIKSPSMLFSKQIGKPIADGILHGMGGLKAGLTKEITTAANQAAAAASAGPSGSAGPAPPGQVRDWLTQALAITHHLDAANLNALYGRTIQESGGNPRAINLWDSNAAAGHPSKGLLQTIDSTFASYMLAGHGNIWNPVDNAIAAIRYMYARYGHIVGPGSGGYGEGGIVAGPYRGAPVMIQAHAGETILPTHKSNSKVAATAGVNIENLTVVSSSPHLWGQASDVMNSISRQVRR